MEFNILYDPWIHVRTTNGEQKQYGLLETLNRAHEIKEVLPVKRLFITEYLVYRFLISFIMDAYQIDDDEDGIPYILEEKAFDKGIIQDYIKKCKNEGVSFDLFDSERPFIQASDKMIKDYIEKNPQKAKEVTVKPISCMCNNMITGNNSCFFSCLDIEEEIPENSYSFTPAEYIMHLLLIYLLSPFTGKSYITSPINKGSYPYFFIAKGETLFETILYSSTRMDHYDQSLPIWRRKELLINLQEEETKGCLHDFFTFAFFPTVLIHPYEIKDGKIKSIEGIFRTIPKDLDPKFKDYFAIDDPHVFYKRKKGRDKNKKEIVIIHPLQPSFDETDMDRLENLVSMSDSNWRNEYNNSKLIEKFKYWGQQGIIERENIHIVMYFHNMMISNSGNNFHGKHEYILPQKILTDERAVQTIKDIITFSNSVFEEFEPLANVKDSKIKNRRKRICPKEILIITKGYKEAIKSDFAHKVYEYVTTHVIKEMLHKQSDDEIIKKAYEDIKEIICNIYNLICYSETDIKTKVANEDILRANINCLIKECKGGKE